MIKELPKNRVKMVQKMKNGIKLNKKCTKN